MDTGAKGAPSWQTWAATLEHDLKTAEEDNNRLKQDNRNLRAQLIQTNPTHYQREQQQQQMPLAARLQHELASTKAAYQKHLNDLGEHNNKIKDDANAQATEAERKHKVTLAELDGAHRELEKQCAEIDKLKDLYAEQGRQLQQARAATAFSQPQQVSGAAPQAFGAVGYQQRIAVLERQLKLSQTENARLLNHSDEKPDRGGEESDDEEAPPIKKEKKTTMQSNLFAGPVRPASYSRDPTPATWPKSTGTPPNIAVSAQLQASKSSERVINVASQPQSRFFVDLTSDDDPTPQSEQDQNQQVVKLPLRRSTQENIMVAPRPLQQTGPAPQPTQAKTSAIPKPQPTQARPPANPKSTTTTKNKLGATRTTQSNKRKHTNASSAPVPVSTPKRARRTRQEEMRDELSDLKINASGFEEPASPRERRRESYEEDFSDDSSDDDFGGNLDFTFIAVCKYDDQGEVADHYTSKDLKGEVGVLWDRIRPLEDKWEDTWGDAWQFEFKKTKGSKGAKPVCVMQKCLKKPTDWDKGEVAGRYACVDCVGLGRPCFTFVRESGGKGEFRLLPLRPNDRTKAVVKGQETRYWINDGRAAVVEEEDYMAF